jgi:hypothetical protein
MLFINLIRSKDKTQFLSQSFIDEFVKMTNIDTSPSLNIIVPDSNCLIQSSFSKEFIEEWQKAKASRTKAHFELPKIYFSPLFGKSLNEPV